MLLKMLVDIEIKKAGQQPEIERESGGDCGRLRKVERERQSEREKE